MDVIYYASGQTKNFQLLKRFDRALGPDCNGFFCDSIGVLVQRLSRLGARPDIIVLLAASHEVLNELLDMGYLFFDTRIILILPDNHRKTVAKGLTLHPRYFTSIDKNMEMVFKILGKMVSIGVKKNIPRPGIDARNQENLQ